MTTKIVILKYFNPNFIILFSILLKAKELRNKLIIIAQWMDVQIDENISFTILRMWCICVCVFLEVVQFFFLRKIRWLIWFRVLFFPHSKQNNDNRIERGKNEKFIGKYGCKSINIYSIDAWRFKGTNTIIFHRLVCSSCLWSSASVQIIACI